MNHQLKRIFVHFNDIKNSGKLPDNAKFRWTKGDLSFNNAPFTSTRAKTLSCPHGLHKPKKNRKVNITIISECCKTKCFCGVVRQGITLELSSNGEIFETINIFDKFYDTCKDVIYIFGDTSFDL